MCFIFGWSFFLYSHIFKSNSVRPFKCDSVHFVWRFIISRTQNIYVNERTQFLFHLWPFGHTNDTNCFDRVTHFRFTCLECPFYKASIFSMVFYVCSPIIMLGSRSIYCYTMLSLSISLTLPFVRSMHIRTENKCAHAPIDKYLICLTFLFYCF